MTYFLVIIGFLAVCYFIAYVLCRCAHQANGKMNLICKGIKFSSAAWPSDVLKKRYNKLTQERKWKRKRS